MPATPRSYVFDPCTVGIYHCWARLVRRAFLCGVDPYSRKDYSYRRSWIRNRLRELAGVMAIDILDYAILGNHWLCRAQHSHYQARVVCADILGVVL